MRLPNLVRRRGAAALAVSAALLSGLVACGGNGDGGDGGGRASSPTPSTGASPSSEPVVYRGVGLVAQHPGREPELCMGPLPAIYPPAPCNSLIVVNWDWAKVGDEESAGGVTWGDYRVTGTLAGSRFSLTQPATPAPAPAPAQAFGGLTTPCPEPHNGFLAADPPRATPELMERAIAAARLHGAELAGIWLDDPDRPRADGTLRKGHIVLNVAFTANLAAREAELRAIWGGAICVSFRERSLTRLQEVQREVTSSPPAGLTVFSAGVAEHTGTVDVNVLVAPPEAQAALDTRYGAGTVRLTAALQPVS